MLDVGTTLDMGDHTVEVLGNPGTHSDRYVIRVDCDPGGPGIKGDFPHKHPALVETFTCISGDMTVRAGRKVSELAVGQKILVPPGKVHGFLNVGSDQLVVESEVIFPNGYTPDLDLMMFAHTYDRLRSQTAANDKTGEPPILQMAVMMGAYREAIRQPGIAGIVLSAIAPIGRLKGYSADPFDKA